MSMKNVPHIYEGDPKEEDEDRKIMAAMCHSSKLKIPFIETERMMKTSNS